MFCGGNMERILIIEDDQEISELLNRTLHHDYELHFAFSGTEAIYKLKERPYDLILLDLMLPGLSGEEVMVNIRETLNVPIIILTALESRHKVVELLKNGANDYMTKPFYIDELKARIDVQLRNNAYKGTLETESANEVLQFKNLVLDISSQSASIHSNPIQFTKKEYQLVELLLRHQKRIFSKQELYELIWQKEYLEDENTINVHIRTIRKKLQQYDQDHAYIETVWGVGIRLMGDK